MAGMAGFGWAADTIGPAASLGGISLILLMTAATAWLFSFYKSHTEEAWPFLPGSSQVSLVQAERVDRNYRSDSFQQHRRIDSRRPPETPGGLLVP